MLGIRPSIKCLLYLRTHAESCIWIHTYAMLRQREACGAAFVQYNVFLCKFTNGGKQTNGLRDYLWLLVCNHFGMDAEDWALDENHHNTSFVNFDFKAGTCIITNSKGQHSYFVDHHNHRFLILVFAYFSGTHTSHHFIQEDVTELFTGIPFPYYNWIEPSFSKYGLWSSIFAQNSNCWVRKNVPHSAESRLVTICPV